MDVDVTKPVSETKLSLTVEEHSNNESKEVKDLTDTLNPTEGVKDSEISGDIVTIAKEGKDPAIPQDRSTLSSSLSDVSVDEDKKTGNKDSSLPSVFTIKNIESCDDEEKGSTISQVESKPPSIVARVDEEEIVKTKDISPPSTAGFHFPAPSVSRISDATVDDNKSCTAVETGVIQASEAKQTGSNEDSSESSGTSAEFIKANVIEEIEMSTFQNVPQSSVSTTQSRNAPFDDVKFPPSGESSQPSESRFESGGVRKLLEIVYKKIYFQLSEKNDVQGIVSATDQEKEKISSSTPCLLSSTKSNCPSEKPPIVQKATSSPVLPIIKITEATDVEEETVASENFESVESSIQAVEAVIKETSDIPDDTATQSLAKDEFAERCEEQIKMVSDPSTSPTENKDYENDPQKERSAFFYISSSEIPPEMRYQSSLETTCSFYRHESLEGPRCLGSKSFHGAIVICSVVVGLVGLALYKLALKGKMPEVYETIGLSFSAIASVCFVFSTLYISFLMCFPDIPNIQYQMVGDVETVTSMERIVYPENYDIEIGCPEIERAHRTDDKTSNGRRVEPNTRHEQGTSGLIDNTQNLKTEVAGLLQTLADVMSKQSFEDPTDEHFTKDQIESPTASSEASLYASTDIPFGTNSSDSDGSKTPSKKDN